MKRKIVHCLALLLAAAFLAGCKGEIERAVEKLGGSEKEQQEAMAAISISARDPLPALVKAVGNKKLNAKARANAALLIGNKCEAAGSETPVPALVKALDASEPDVRVAIVEALAKIPGDKSLDALHDIMNRGDEAAAAAWETLKRLAMEKVLAADKLSGEESLPQKERLLKQALDINPRDADVAKALAGIYELQGDDARALATYDAAGQYARSLRIIGPFRDRFEKKDFNPARLDFRRAQRGKRGRVSWQEVEAPPSGVVDMRRMRELKASRASYYAAFTVNAPAAREVYFLIQSPDSTALWVNGAEAFRKDAAAMAKTPEHAAKVKLRKGDNLALLKVTSRRYARFSVRVSDLKFKKMEDVELKPLR